MATRKRPQLTQEGARVRVDLVAGLLDLCNFSTSPLLGIRGEWDINLDAHQEEIFLPDAVDLLDTVKFIMLTAESATYVWGTWKSTGKRGSIRVSLADNGEWDYTYPGLDAPNKGRKPRNLRSTE